METTATEKNLIREIIDPLYDQHEELAGLLNSLVDDFRFDVIIDLTKIDYD